MLLGKFYGIGVGPGEPDLLTLKAYKILQMVQVVCGPKSKSEAASLALSIVQPHLNQHQKIIELIMPMQEDPDVLSVYWNEAADTIAWHLVQGQDVAFLTLGDPSFYSTYTYLIRSLKQKLPNITWEIIPGIMSISAAAARAGISLVEGKEKMAVIARDFNETELSSIIEKFNTVVFMKLTKDFNAIIDFLHLKGLTANSVLVSRCGLPGEEIISGLNIRKGQPIDYFSLLILKRR
jgi:precorrin-2/cobalt-factor-2 C20-methyltransferase